MLQVSSSHIFRFLLKDLNSTKNLTPHSTVKVKNYFDKADGSRYIRVSKSLVFHSLKDQISSCSVNLQQIGSTRTM